MPFLSTIAYYQVEMRLTPTLTASASMPKAVPQPEAAPYFYWLSPDIKINLTFSYPNLFLLLLNKISHPLASFSWCPLMLLILAKVGAVKMYLCH